MPAKLLLFVFLFLPLFGEETVYEIRTNKQGFHRLDFSDLVKTNPNLGNQNLGRLFLTNQGKVVRFWLDDRDGDNAFGSGDSLYFRGDLPRGEYGFRHEYSDYNVYILSTGEKQGPRIDQTIGGKFLEQRGNADHFYGIYRVEKDLINMRFNSRRFEAHESWYWQKLSCIDAEPFVHTFDLPIEPGLEQAEGEIRIGLRGFSYFRNRPNDGTTDHVLDITLNGHKIGSPAWNGREENQLTLSFPHHILKKSGNELSLKIPERINKGNDRLIVDVSILNWLDIRYRRAGSVAKDEQVHFYLDANHPEQVVVNTDAKDFFLFWQNGSGQRLTRTQSKMASVDVTVVQEQTNLWVVPDGAWHRPSGVFHLEPDPLNNTEQQADYIIIAHPSLAKAVEPLAEFHRTRGLQVKVVDVFDVYYNFSHGVPHPDGIREFLKYTDEYWQRPAPRFVLLVGDASWDFQTEEADSDRYVDEAHARDSDQFIHIPVTEYDSSAVARARNLIPTFYFYNYSGHSASDNRFVAFGKHLNKPYRPSMAIGRLPLVTPEEVRAVVKKTIAYSEKPPIGPWRRNVLWITNEERGLQATTNRVASSISQEGFSSTKIYPQKEEKDNSQNTGLINKALNQGQNLVYFFGHGGRFIWRTGPPDLKKNHDLFTLDDLDKLDPNDRQSVIVSFTCFSAPFDHPSADSIGEKFLRMPDKGSIAFIGASWRNAPTRPFIRAMMKGLTAEATVGEALLAAKQAVSNPTLLETYNLMGDPALPLVHPPRDLELQAERKPDGSLTVSFSAPNKIQSGEGIIDLVDEGGIPLENRAFQFSDGTAKIRFQNIPENAVALSGYLWNETLGTESMGRIPLPLEQAAQNQDLNKPSGEPGQ